MIPTPPCHFFLNGCSSHFVSNGSILENGGHLGKWRFLSRPFANWAIGEIRISYKFWSDTEKNVEWIALYRKYTDRKKNLGHRGNRKVKYELTGNQGLVMRPKNDIYRTLTLLRNNWTWKTIHSLSQGIFWHIFAKEVDHLSHLVMVRHLW